MDLSAYGWNEDWERLFREAGIPVGHPARIVAEHRGSYRVRAPEGEMSARVTGRFRHAASGPADLPAVGDWVVIESDGGGEAVIHAVLPRAAKFSRKTAGARTEEQVVAANVDTVWIVSAFGYDLNPSRIERYIALVRQGGASPVVVLTKADLADETERTVEELGLRLADTPVHAVSALCDSGLDPLRAYLAPGRTIALLGSTGAGKSTLLNRLAGREVMATAGLRKGVEKGRHKTTHRQLVLLPSGGLLLDTPGMRELQLWEADEGIATSFADIDALADGCRFRDCTHESEPGCAVRAAVEAGDLPQERLDSFHKLKKEAAYFDRKLDVRSAMEKERRMKWIAKERRRYFNKKD
ncbi:MAG: ribosome small subunit-dependent GTPase A [Candidatus Eisenbacteria bacterium]|nr:ribosome small subunit-dependent GTPase A [Candidatus Eisenbacteria bacterium]